MRTLLSLVGVCLVSASCGSPSSTTAAPPAATSNQAPPAAASSPAPPTATSSPAPPAATSSPLTAPTKPVAPASTNVRKKDGTFDERDNDLAILCEDWLWWRNQILKANAEGDTEKVVEMRQKWQRTNQWLKDYHQDDVDKTCAPVWK